MRVCLICSQIGAWGKIGGFGTNTRNLGRGLVQAGVDLHVVVPRRPGQAAVERLDGMTIHGQSLREVYAGQRTFREIDADIYHVSEPNIGGYWAQQALPDRLHVVTCMDPRDAADWRIELRHATWSRRAKFPLQWFYESGPLVKRAVQRADRVFVEAAFLKPKAQALYDLDRVPGLLPKPVDIPDGPFTKSDTPLCAFVGRLDPRKRPLLFLDVAARMPEVRFVVIGRAHDAAYQQLVEQRARGLGNVELLGFIDPFTDDRMHRILSEAWMLVHPAAREGLPTAFQEASAREAAVVAFVDPAGYVRQFGALADEAGGAEALERAIRRLIASGEWRAKGRAGRVFNRENHSVDASVHAHLAAYRALRPRPDRRDRRRQAVPRPAILADIASSA